MPDPINETEFLRTLAEKALRDSLYHERALQREHKRVAFVRSLVARCVPDLDVRAIEKEHKEGEARDEDDEPTDADDFFRKEFLRALSGLAYQEGRLQDAHNKIACLTALILRWKYEIDLHEIKQSQIKKLEERK